MGQVTTRDANLQDRTVRARAGSDGAALAWRIGVDSCGGAGSTTVGMGPPVGAAHGCVLLSAHLGSRLLTGDLLGRVHAPADEEVGTIVRDCRKRQGDRVVRSIGAREHERLLFDT